MRKLLEDKEGMGQLFSNVTNVSIQVTRKVTIKYLRRIFIATTAKTRIFFAEVIKVKMTETTPRGLPKGKGSIH